MNIEYELLAIYGVDKQGILDATKEFNLLIDEGFIEKHEVMEVCQNNNVVILYEYTESTGYSEVILINNKGKHIDGISFSIEDIRKIQSTLRTTSIFNVMDKIDQLKITKHLQAHGIDEREFVNEHLDEFYMDKYEDKKENLQKNIKKYFT